MCRYKRTSVQVLVQVQVLEYGTLKVCLTARIKSLYKYGRLSVRILALTLSPGSNAQVPLEKKTHPKQEVPYRETRDCILCGRSDMHAYSTIYFFNPGFQVLLARDEY